MDRVRRVLIELQSHSTVSDGQLEPSEVVAEAAKAGVTTLALTDHDAVAGVPEALRAAEELRIELVPAIEMSCVHRYAEDLHVCGYWVDLEKIAPACDRAQQERRTRAGEIVQNLQREGFDLTLEDAIREAGAADSIGRPHIARAAGATGDLGPFFEEYLVPGAKAFVPRRWPTAEEAVETIREAGGVAVVAHPYWDVKDPAQVEDLVRSLKPDGIEAYYPSHTKEQTEHLLQLCDELDLVPTASSDYHGPTHKTFAEFGAYDTFGLGEPQVPAKP
jgi:3',5'-nucleoside bisphosphate phosphatase